MKMRWNETEEWKGKRGEKEKKKVEKRRTRRCVVLELMRS